MDAEQINCYRVNYNAEYWKNVAEKVGNQCSSPLGAVLAVNALCDEVERLQKQRDELMEAAQAVVDRWDSPLWKNLPHTGDFIARLRKAIASVEGGAA